jgi:hypothetical protein
MNPLEVICNIKILPAQHAEVQIPGVPWLSWHDKNNAICSSIPSSGRVSVAATGGFLNRQPAQSLKLRNSPKLPPRRQGEEETLHHLSFLPREFVTLPASIVHAGPVGVEIDALVFGPNGVHVVEVKNWAGRIRVSPAGWSREKRGVVEGTASGVAQALRNADVVRRVLDQRGFAQVPVHALVAMAHKAAVIDGQDAAPVVKADVAPLVIQNTPGVLPAGVTPEQLADVFRRFVLPPERRAGAPAAAAPPSPAAPPPPPPTATPSVPAAAPAHHVPSRLRGALPIVAIVVLVPVAVVVIMDRPGHPTTAAPPKAPAVRLVSASNGVYDYDVSAGSVAATVSFTGQCWVDVASNGTTLFAGMRYPGNISTWKSTGQLYLKLGAPAAAGLTVDGAPVTMPAGMGVWTGVFRASR